MQSNVTTRSRLLEESLGTPLFDRINRRLVITPAGSLLESYADRPLNLADEARDAVQRRRTASVAAPGPMETTAATRLPAVIADFRRRVTRRSSCASPPPTPPGWQTCCPSA